MAYAHSFSQAFYGDPYNTTKSERPTTVCDALASMPDKDWRKMCKAVFKRSADHVDIDDVLREIMAVDTVGTLSVPVDVWIDGDGFYTVDVYDER